MSSYYDTITRLVSDSDILRVYPNTVVSIYAAGTSTLIDQVLSNNDGSVIFPNLNTGEYDIKVNGTLVKTINYVKADHTHNIDYQFDFLYAGDITGDVEPSNSMAIGSISANGIIKEIYVTCAQVDATGDITVHLCKGVSDGSSPLTIAADSIWSHRINPGVIQYRVNYSDLSPGLSVASGDILQLGIKYTGSTCSGVSVKTIIRVT